KLVHDVASTCLEREVTERIDLAELRPDYLEFIFVDVDEDLVLVEPGLGLLPPLDELGRGRTCLGAFTLASTAASTATLLFSGFLVVWASVVVGLDGARSTGLSPVSGLATSATPAAFLLRSVFAFVAVRGLVVTCGHAATAAGGPIGSIGSIGARIGV